MITSLTVIVVQGGTHETILNAAGRSLASRQG
jgi:hypothetical protein